VNILLVLLGLGYLWMLSQAGVGALVSGPSAEVMFDEGGAFGFVVGSQAIGLAAGEYWRLVTPVFLHYGLIHLAVNAYSLWIIGTMVEREYGRWRLIAMFFATGIFASGVSYWLGPPEVGAGASGAVFGLLGVILAHAYQRRGTAVGAMRMRMIGQVLLLNLLITFMSPRIDWRAHLGGFVAGAIAGYLAERDRGSALTNAVGIAAVAVAGVAIAVAHTTALTAA
jgi:rhomboid protease GluP